VGGGLDGGGVPTASAFSSQVAFRPRASGEASGELTFTANSPTAPQVRIPLEGRAEGNCLAAVSSFLDFGPVRLDCPPVPRRGRILNTCPQPVTVSRLWLGAGTSGQSQLTPAPTLPRAPGPGEGFELQVDCARNVRGQHTTPLFAQADGESGPLLVPLLAETNLPGRASAPRPSGRGAWPRTYVTAATPGCSPRCCPPPPGYSAPSSWRRSRRNRQRSR